MKQRIVSSAACPRGRALLIRWSCNGWLLACVVLATTTAAAPAQIRITGWERDIAAFEAKDRKQPPPRNGIVFVGSSSIRFWDVSKSFPGQPVINRGFGGSELADSVRYAPRIVLPYQPRIVVLYAGDNDLAAGKTPEQIAADFQAFTRVVHNALPQTRIIFLSIKPSPLRWRLHEKSDRANALIAGICKSQTATEYVDVATPLLGAEGKPRRELYRWDGLHLNDKGYEIWAAVVGPHIR
jgi:lysophospholipase L1-like esterase